MKTKHKKLVAFLTVLALLVATVLFLTSQASRESAKTVDNQGKSVSKKISVSQRSQASKTTPSKAEVSKPKDEANVGTSSASSAVDLPPASTSAVDTRQSAPVADSPSTPETQASQSQYRDRDSSNPPQHPVNSSVNLNALISGDVSSIAGTWTNDLGESITISAADQIIHHAFGKTYALDANSRLDANIYYGYLYLPQSENGYGGPAFVLVPAGTLNPHTGEVQTVDSIMIGQSSLADAHPYVRK